MLMVVCWSRQVSEVKNIMVDNIEKVLERGEKIELLVDKTDNLRFQVRERPQTTRSVVPKPSVNQGSEVLGR